MVRRVVRYGVVGTAVFLAIFLLYIAADIYVYSRKVELVKADSAIVLGAAVFRDRPSPVLRERIRHAVMLYEEGYVEKIIFTGGQGRTGNAAEGVIAANYAQTLGVPEAAILIEAQSVDTQQNLAFAHTLAAENDLHTFLIVSTPFHMKRAMAIAADLGMDARPSPTQTIQWISWFTKTRAFVQEVVSYLLYLVESA